MNTSELKKFSNIATESLYKAGKVLLNPAIQDQTGKNKGDGEIGVQGDVQAERLLITDIQKNYPDFLINSEEKGIVQHSSTHAPTYTVFIDPLDGSANYDQYNPCWGTMLALFEETEPVFAALYIPLTNNLVWAAKNLGFWKNNKIISLQPDTRPLTETTLYLEKGKLVPNSLQTLSTFMKNHSAQFRSVRMLGSIAVASHDTLQTGRAASAALIAIGCKITDLAPTAALLQLANKSVVDSTNGKAWKLGNSGYIAGNTNTVAQLYTLLNTES